MNAHESQARLLHRIESFSDLVMGFSLALLSLTLVVPEHARELFVNPWWLLEYFWTFMYIASVWYSHQRLFERIFFPNMLSIVVNFTMLSMLVLVVYFVQVFGRMHDDADKAFAILGYFAAFSTSLICIGLLHIIGARANWARLPVKERRYAIGRAVRTTTFGLSLFGAVVCEYFVAGTFTPNSTSILSVVAIVMIFVARAAQRIVEARLGPALVEHDSVPVGV